MFILPLQNAWVSPLQNVCVFLPQIAVFLYDKIPMSPLQLILYHLFLYDKINVCCCCPSRLSLRRRTAAPPSPWACVAVASRECGPCIHQRLTGSKYTYRTLVFTPQGKHHSSSSTKVMHAHPTQINLLSGESHIRKHTLTLSHSSI